MQCLCKWERTWYSAMVAMVAESMTDNQARENEEEEQGACASCGATMSHAYCSNEQWIENGRCCCVWIQRNSRREQMLKAI